MKKILILFIVLGGLVGTAVIYQRQQNADLNTATTRGIKTRTQLLPALKIGEVHKIRIKDAKGEVTLVISADRKTATIAERGNYLASIERINSVLADLHGQVIASKMQIGKAAWSKNKLQPPGEGAPDSIGTQVELLGEGDKIVTSFVLGADVSIAGGRNPSQFGQSSQRLVRLPDDGETVWVIGNNFTDLEPKPEAWLDKAFIDVQKIREVTVTPPQADEGWKVSRKAETETDYAFVNPKTGEGLDNTKLTLASLLASPVFNDVVQKDKAAEVLKDAIKAQVVTFDGFTYDLQVAKHSKDGADRYYLAFNVSAALPASRPPVKDEKEEDKKKADEAFAAQRKALEDRLAKEQKFAGWVFEVSEYTVNNFFKKRSEIVQVEAKATPAAASPLPGGLSFPSFTPPGAPAPAAPVAPSPAPAPETPVKSALPPVEVPAVPAAEAPASAPAASAAQPVPAPATPNN